MRAMPRACIVPGCNTHAVPGRSKCVVCAAKDEVRNQSRPWRDYGGTWPRIRAAYIRKHPTCSRAGCDKPTVDVDHVRPLQDLYRLGGQAWARRHHESNLRALCHPHHSERTAREQSGWGRPA